MAAQLHNLLAEIVADNLSVYFLRWDLQKIESGTGELKPEEIEAVGKIINVGMRIALRLNEDNSTRFNQQIFREKSRIDKALDILTQKTTVLPRVTKNG